MKDTKPGELYNQHKEMAMKKRHKNWIAGAIKHPGALHRELGVKQGSKIPAGKLAAAAKKGGTLGRRARLAETLKGLHHKKGGKKKKSMLNTGAKNPLSQGSLRMYAPVGTNMGRGARAGVAAPFRHKKNDHDADDKKKGMKCKKHNKMRCKHCK